MRLLLVQELQYLLARREIRRVVRHLQPVARTGSTVLMVTHDVDEAVLLSDRIVMMTNGPAATIGEVLTVGLPSLSQGPRDRLEMAHNPTYLAAREQVLQFLYQKQAHVEKEAA